MLRFLGAWVVLAGVAQDRALDGARLLTPAPRQNEKVEIGLSADPAPENPFDPNKVTLDATVTPPSGKTLRVPGFWLQDYTRSLKDPNAKDAARAKVLRQPIGGLIHLRVGQ